MFDWLKVLPAPGGRRLSDYCYSIPNGAWLAGTPAKRAAVMASLKRQGLRTGASDIVCMLPCRPYSGLYLELKRDKKSKPTPEQLGFLSIAAECGYAAEVAHGLQEAIAVFKKVYPFIDGKPDLAVV